MTRQQQIRVFSLVCGIFCGVLTPAVAQNTPKNPVAEAYERITRTEEEGIRRIVERLRDSTETEKEHWEEEMVRTYLSRVPLTGGNEKFGTWFTLLSNGESVWNRNTTTRRARDLHERINRRLKRSEDTVITQAEFMVYAGKYLGANSPPWRVMDPESEANRLLRYLDADSNSQLRQEECSPTLARIFNSYDKNNDAQLDAAEYAVYLEQRVKADLAKPRLSRDDRRRIEREKYEYQKAIREGRISSNPYERASQETETPRPVVYTSPEELPKEIPSWFRDFDLDQDLQIGLYEWIKMGQPVEQFNEMDENADGFLEAVEYLRIARRQKEAEQKNPWGSPTVRAESVQKQYRK